MADTYEYTPDYTPEEIFKAEESDTTYRQRNHEMNLAWQFIARTDMSVFLTGKAGTGKTTFLKRLKDLMPKRMVVLAPTGVAAINAGGQTIHSFFQLPFGPFVPGRANTSEATKKAYKMTEHKKNLIRTLDLLVIDEVSMVRADLLDQIDDALRRYRDRTKPFGGVQLLLIGDLMQLSPVARSDEWEMLKPYYDSPYFFSSHALREKPYITIELQHIYRQQAHLFIDLLAKVRDGILTPPDLSLLNSRYQPGFQPQGPGWIRLTTHNNSADNYNDMKLRELPGPSYTYKAKVKNDFPESSYPASTELTLKLGAQVMFIKNDPSGQHQYYNGKIGIVTDIAEDAIKVSCPDDTEPIDVSPVVWENIKYYIDPDSKAIMEETVGEFWQVPLRLAWAITVHKSQGLTFDNAVLDINASFAHGQTYVALSRCRTLEGLVLTAPLTPASVITDMSVNSYITKELNESKESVKALPALMQRYALTLLDDLYDFTPILMDVQWTKRVVDEHLSHQQPELLEALQSIIGQLQQSVVPVAARFRTQYYAASAETNGRFGGTPMEGRIKESCKYFKRRLEEIFGNAIKDALALRIGNRHTAETLSRALTALRKALDDKIQILDGMADKEFTTANYLNVKAQVLLGQEKPSGRTASAPHKKKQEKGATVMITLDMVEQGLTPEQIAVKRSLAPSTIWGHVSALVQRGELSADKVIPRERRETIMKVLEGNPALTLTEAKELLPDDYLYDEVRIMMSDRHEKQAAKEQHSAKE